jgi:hypothetical protein
MFRRVFVALVAAVAAHTLGFAEPTPAGNDKARDTSGERVGKYCDPERIRFEGNKTFSAEALRSGLEATFDFREVSHPFAPLADYLTAIETRIRTGYQHGGFPDATVAVGRDEVSTQIVVKVQEGPRYHCGSVRVKGLKNIDPKLMVQRLSTSSEEGRKKQSALVMERGDNGAPNEQKDSDEDSWGSSLWTPSKPAHLSEASLQTLGMMVSNVFWEFGFASPRFTIRATRQEKTHLAELAVDVQDEGPRAFIDRIEVSGLKKNSRESLLRYLKLKPGLPLTSNVISQVETRLWDAARFLHYEVEPKRPDDRGAAVVKISVLEYEDAPALDKEFSPMEKAMLRAREWWAKPESLRGELVCQGSIPDWQGMTFALGISAKKGMALVVRNGSNAAAGGDWGMVVATNLLGFYPPEGRPELVIPDIDGGLTLRLSLTGTSNEQPFSVSFTAGFNSTNGSPAPPCKLHLTLAPVALVGLAHNRGGTNHFGAGKWVASSAGRSVEVDDRTGQFSVRGDTGTNGIAYQLAFSTNAFEEIQARLLAARDHGTNRYDSTEPYGSFASFTIEEFLRCQLVQNLVLTNLTGEKRIHAAKAASALFGKVAFAPLDRLIQQQQADTSDDADWFVIPEPQALTGTTESQLMQVAAYWVLRFNDKLFPVGSWPGTLLRETALMYEGRSHYAGEALNEVYSSDETGPLGYLAVAELLKLGQSPTNSAFFAAQGLKELTSYDFGHDARLLFNGEGVVGQSFVNLAETLRDMDDGDLQYLESLLSPAEAELIRQSVTAMRAAKGRPTYEVLAPALSAYWRSELKQQVVTALKGVTAEK